MPIQTKGVLLQCKKTNNKKNRKTMKKKVISKAILERTLPGKCFKIYDSAGKFDCLVHVKKASASYDNVLVEFISFNSNEKDIYNYSSFDCTRHGLRDLRFESIHLENEIDPSVFNNIIDSFKKLELTFISESNKIGENLQCQSLF